MENKVRFSDVNSVGKVYTSPKEFFAEEFCHREHALKVLRESADQIPPRIVKKISPVTGHEIKYKPVFINFMKCEDIECDGSKEACFLMSGVDTVGNRVMVVQRSINPFIIVSVPDHFHENVNDFKRHLKTVMGCREPIALKTMKMYNYHKFQLSKTPKIKVTFTTLMARKMAIKRLLAEQYYVGEDDNDYVPQYLRHNKSIPIDTWLGLPTFTKEFLVPFFRDGIYHKIYEIDNDHDFVQLSRDEFGFKDNTLINAWDIETKKIGQDMTVPAPGDDYYISAISSSIGTWYDPDPLISVVFTVINLDPSTLTVPDKVPPILVLCKNEKQMLMSYYKFIARFRPEYEHAFNGGRFDYPIMRDRVEFWTDDMGNTPIKMDKPKTPRDYFMSAYCQTIDPMYGESFDKCVRKFQVKMEAGRNSELLMPSLFGTAFIDSMVLLVKAYPKVEEKGLSNFLQRAGLGNKEDMPYLEMHKLTEATEVLDPDDDTYTFENVVPDDIESSYPQFHDKMCRFMYYSYIDSLKLYKLFHKESFMFSCRAMGALARFPVMGAFYRAAGALLTNMIADDAYNASRLFSIRYKSDDNSDTEESFSGAYVVNPVYGLHVDRPITGIDFSSLYPSLMAAFNLSPDMVVDDDEIDFFKKLGYRVLSLQIPYKIVKKGKKKDKNKDSVISEEMCKANFIQHNGIIDPEKDTHIIERYVKNMKWTCGDEVVMKIDNVAMNETCKIYQSADKMLREYGYDPEKCKYSDEVVKIYGRRGLLNECMGVNARLGQKLFDLRNIIKKPFGNAKTLKELMEAKGWTNAYWDPVKNVHCKDENVPGAVLHTYAQICEIYEIYNAKQLAIKIMANTIYGKSGENRGFIYALEVAAGITHTGKYMAIKPVIELVESLGCEVMYGDTDSAYIKCPHKIYERIIERYTQLRFEKFGVPHDVSVHEHEATLSDEETELKVAELWTPMVIETRKYIEFVTRVIADTLCFNNGTRYLTMAYEEVGFPTYLSGKKKYALVAHEKEINFFPHEIFLRGFDFKKRGQTKIAKQIGNTFLKRIMHPSFHGNTLELMKETLRNYKTAGADYNDFVLFKTYRKDKKAAEVLGIVDYMKTRHKELKKSGDYVAAELYTPPLSGESFPIVYVNRFRGYDLNGKLDTKFKTAELAEPLRVVEGSKESFSINLFKYLEKMKGFLGRLIISDKIFDSIIPEREDEESLDEYYKRTDKIRSNAAQKYILNIFKIIQNNGSDLTVNGRLAKKVSKIGRESDINVHVSGLIKSLVNGTYSEIVLDNFTYVFGNWIRQMINVKSIPKSSLPKGASSTSREINDHYSKHTKLLQSLLKETIDNIRSTLKTMTIPDLDAFAHDVAVGAISVHLGAVYLKHPHRNIIDMFVRVFSVIRGLEYRQAERLFVLAQKNKPIITKAEIKSDAAEWAKNNAAGFMY